MEMKSGIRHLVEVNLMAGGKFSKPQMGVILLQGVHILTEMVALIFGSSVLKEMVHLVL